jgi:hypothetical protein
MNRVINRVMYRVKYDSILGITEISQYLQHSSYWISTQNHLFKPNIVVRYWWT